MPSKKFPPVRRHFQSWRWSSSPAASGRFPNPCGCDVADPTFGELCELMCSRLGVEMESKAAA